MRTKFFLYIVLALMAVGLAVFVWAVGDGPKIVKKSENDFGTDKICVQVVTPARNSKTGEIRNFPTPCDVPEGWEVIN